VRGRDSTDLAHEPFFSRIFGNERCSAFANCVRPKTGFVTEDQDSQLGEQRSERTYHLESAYSRERQVYDKDIRVQLVSQTDGRVAVLGFPDDRHVRFVFQRHPDPIAGGSVAIGYDDSHHVHVIDLRHEEQSSRPLLSMRRLPRVDQPFRPKRVRGRAC